MPRLQVDGIDVGEIDARTAERLIKSAQRFGLGEQQGVGGFQTSIQTHLPPARYEMAHVLIEMGWFTLDRDVYEKG